MTAALLALFGVIVVAAASFAAWPALRSLSGRMRLVASAALALFVGLVGAGSYFALGRPALAVRTLQGHDVQDVNGAVALLVHHLRAQPDDLRGWAILGQAYMSAHDGEDAAKAYQRAIALSQAAGRPIPALYSNYGMALTTLSTNGVPDEAERAFRYALSLDPSDGISLFFLGQLSASRGQGADAVMLWQRLLEQVPADSELHQQLVDSIAHIKQAQGGAAPDVGAMVAGLAARLKQSPDDALGWQRLVRAYAVLGDAAKARSALADARAAMAKNPDALNALKAEAKQLKLEP
ncbi:MAG TPA: tetratricopeptide repeat protein [Rhizomicrobium sp.]|nr:tetratricopeptide repeat protein [Rhizomicrobium sp.]